MRLPFVPTRALGTTAVALLLGSSLAYAATAVKPAPKVAHKPAKLIDVKITEGTSMSVAVSPDGKFLATDLQGSIYLVPSTGGEAKRITTLFNDARQPIWSPDGQWIVFFGYLDGGYDLWAIHPDGTGQKKLTWGNFDDREPAFSHDGTHIAFASDRDNPIGSSYNIWTLDMRSGELKRVTSDTSENHMPTWSPDDKEIAFSSTREGSKSIWAANLTSGQTHQVVTGTGTLAAPSFSPSGKLVYHVTAGRDSSHLESEGKTISGDENAFAFRVSWASPDTFYYVSDGLIRKRTLGQAQAQTIPFVATLQVTRADGSYTRTVRDFDSTAPQKAIGIVRPAISPDGKQVAFAAVGDIYVMPVGGKPVNITDDRFLDTDPNWSPDGKWIVFSSDRGKDHLQLWLYNTETRAFKELTHIGEQPQGAVFSPDGKTIAFFGVEATWRSAAVFTVNVESGTVAKVHKTLNAPGMPTWSPDGRRLALANIAPYSKTVREGTNQVFTFSSTNGAENPEDKWFTPVPNLSIDSRGFCGPVWSPDGTKMAAIYEGVLSVWPVSFTGEPVGPVRHVTTEIAMSPTWTGDSKHILYQSLTKLKEIDLDTGDISEVPVDLTYKPSIPKTKYVIHVGKLVDGKSETARENVDIIVTGNHITGVRSHSAAAVPGAKMIDASTLTAMPGLIESHSHLQKDYGEAAFRAWLAFGITTVRSPGDTPYEGVEDIEAIESGVRPGPRLFNTGYLFEWQRTYYKMGIAISSAAHLDMELELSKALHHDLLKSYVRLPDLQQKRLTEFAHEQMGVPVTTHEIYPAAFVGVDSTEHTSATSRRGYSPKVATLQRTYQDVNQLFGQSQRNFTPDVPNPGLTKLFKDEPGMKNDPRFNIYAEWLRLESSGQRPNAEIPAALRAQVASAAGNLTPLKFVIEAQNAGANIVAGTDTPNAFALHGEMESYVLGGMTPYQALKTATVNPAKALNLDAGTIEIGKLADILIVDGNPLQDIAAAHKVKEVFANGRLYTLEDLVNNTVQSDKAK